MSVVIQSGFNGIAQPINNPRLCFDAWPATGTATNSATGANPNWVTDGETWSQWTAGSIGSTLTITLNGARLIDYVGIAAHTLGSTGANVTMQFDIAGVGAWVSPTGIGVHSPTDDSAILWLFDSVLVYAVRFVISAGTAPASIAVAQAGMALEMPRGSVYTGKPISESADVRYRHQQSIRGDVLGRSVEGAQLSFDMMVNNLPETFREAVGAITWKGFVEHIEQTGPFFIASKPSSYPDDVAYARVTEQPRFIRQRPNRNISGEVQLTCMGYRAP